MMFGGFSFSDGVLALLDIATFPAYITRTKTRHNRRKTCIGIENVNTASEISAFHRAANQIIKLGNWGRSALECLNILADCMTYFALC
jgi:hypothetical protein